MRKNLWKWSVVSTLLTLAGAHADEKTALLGTWITQGGESRVEITQAADGTFVGRIIWLAELNFPPEDSEAGKPKHDCHNPDSARQSTPIIGLEILKGFIYGSGGTWSGGTIYDPKIGKTYKCKISLAEEGKKLNVRGFLGISLIGRTEIWERYRPAPAAAK